MQQQEFALLVTKAHDSKGTTVRTGRVHQEQINQCNKIEHPEIAL